MIAARFIAAIVGYLSFQRLRYTFRTMQEFPDANAGGLDPLGAPGPKCKTPLRGRVRVWTIILVLYGAILGMAAGAVLLLRSVFSPGVAADDRLLHLFCAAGLLAPLGFTVQYFIRVRLKTGRWRGTPEQRKQDREQRLAKCSTAQGKPVCGNANRNSLVTYAIKWASCSAFSPASSPWQRTAAWLVLIAYTLTMIAVAAFGVIAIGAAFDNNPLTTMLLMIALGLFALAWPAIAAWKLIRGIRAGKVGTTPEELAALRVQRSAWAARESQKPLRTKLINTAFAAAIYGYWWMRVTVHHAQHPHESWITPAIFTPAFLYSIWIQFRKTKSTPTATDH